MQLEWKSDLNGVDWAEAVELFRRAPLGLRTPDALRTAFANSLYRHFIYDAGRLVGMGRSLGDGADCAVICDIALDPEYQGRGLGRELVNRLVAESATCHGKVILYAVPAKVPFYQKLGFRRMKTAMGIFFSQPAELEAAMLENAE